MRTTGSVDKQSHQLAFQVLNEQLGGNGGKETSCFPPGNQGAVTLAVSELLGDAMFI